MISENEINEFMKDFMKLCWIEYPNDKKLIDSDERFLINGLKPLLNIKNNPNALAAASDNPTKHYKKRRVEIVAKSKSKLNCKKETKTIKKTKNYLIYGAIGVGAVIVLEGGVDCSNKVRWRNFEREHLKFLFQGLQPRPKNR
jgi:hypothetical protein